MQKHNGDKPYIYKPSWSESIWIFAPAGRRNCGPIYRYNSWQDALNALNTWLKVI